MNVQSPRHDPITGFLNGRIDPSEGPNVSKALQRVRHVPHELVRRIFAVSEAQLRLAMASMIALDPATIRDGRIQSVISQAPKHCQDNVGRLAFCLSQFLNANVQAVEIGDDSQLESPAGGAPYAFVCLTPREASADQDNAPGLVVDLATSEFFVGDVWALIDQRLHHHAQQMKRTTECRGPAAPSF